MHLLSLFWYHFCNSSRELPEHLGILTDSSAISVEHILFPQLIKEQSWLPSVFVNKSEHIARQKNVMDWCFRFELLVHPWAIIRAKKISSVQFSRSVGSDSLWPHESQHARPPCPSPTPGVYLNSYPSSRWCHPAISYSVVPVSSCLQSLPASGSFPMSQCFPWGGQSIGVSASTSVFQWTPRTDLL